MRIPSTTEFSSPPRENLFTRSAAGKKSMGAKARFVSSNNGTVRKITPGNMKNIPNAMRPAVRQGDKKPKSVSKAAAKRVARPRLNNEARATRMFGAFLNKTRKAPKAKAAARPSAARKVRSNVGVARKTNAQKASVAAARKRAAVFRALERGLPRDPQSARSARTRASRASPNANKAATVAATRMMASAKRAAAKGLARSAPTRVFPAISSSPRVEHSTREWQHSPGRSRNCKFNCLIIL